MIKELLLLLRTLVTGLTRASTPKNAPMAPPRRAERALSRTSPVTNEPCHAPKSPTPRDRAQGAHDRAQNLQVPRTARALFFPSFIEPYHVLLEPCHVPRTARALFFPSFIEPYHVLLEPCHVPRTALALSCLSGRVGALASLGTMISSTSAATWFRV